MKSISVETDLTSPTGYSLHWQDEYLHFGTPESIELFRPVVSFRFVSLYGDFVARRERRAGRVYWYGYKRFGAVVRKVYLGRQHRLTLHSLEESARLLHGRNVTQMQARETY